ncbi:Rieske (2Fe-2S) protein [Thalassoroseus pseudoceratinae]|uniref:Rieske (2Fe-2S) protein n=1 Tax=Thalassoroseus pseudoceratinae TaxID=2713176 RepID=UPI00141F68F7|nr:Rieske (2Fe-2S) protein [Thalassoroseus pseudoceratinae]
MAERVRIAGVSEIPPGTSREFAVSGRVVAVFNVDGVVHAMDGVCPHAGGPLGEGQLNGNIVTCPWHGWQFDVETGRHCLNPNLVHAIFAVSIEGEDIYLELPEA